VSARYALGLVGLLAVGLILVGQPDPAAAGETVAASFDRHGSSLAGPSFPGEVTGPLSPPGTGTEASDVGPADTTAGKPPPDERGNVSADGRFAVRADAAADRIAVTHEGAEPLAVEGLDVTVAVDGDELAHQPPVPFFASRGFASGPSGPFNAAAEGPWKPGETGAFVVAATNDPGIAPGDPVSVTVDPVDGSRTTVSTVAE
jgi:hypothetical protein